MNRHALETPRGVLRWRGTGVLGIVNVTPDSFSDGGLHAAATHAVRAAVTMMQEGALLVDVGAESTRPGSGGVSAETELDRLLPVIRELTRLGIPFSVDTRKAEVADAAFRAGAWLLNDIGGLRDPDMLETCARHGAPAVLMHMQGEPATMQDNPTYSDVVSEVAAWLGEAAARALRAGVPAVVTDPGIGFGKTVTHNLELLRGLREVRTEGALLLVGASRKGFIGRLADEPAAAARDPGSLAVHLHAARLGAELVRVHDVRGHVQALRVQEALEGAPA